MTPTAAHIEPRQRKGLLHMAGMMQTAVLGMIAGLHTSGSMQDCFTGMGTMMQCTLAWWQHHMHDQVGHWLFARGVRVRAVKMISTNVFMNASYFSVR